MWKDDADGALQVYEESINDQIKRYMASIEEQLRLVSVMRGQQKELYGFLDSQSLPPQHIHIRLTELLSVFEKDRVWHIPEELDLVAMQRQRVDLTGIGILAKADRRTLNEEKIRWCDVACGMLTWRPVIGGDDVIRHVIAFHRDKGACQSDTQIKLPWRYLRSSVISSRAWIDFRSIDTPFLLFPTRMSELIFTTIVRLNLSSDTNCDRKYGGDTNCPFDEDHGSTGSTNNNPPPRQAVAAASPYTRSAASPFTRSAAAEASRRRRWLDAPEPLLVEPAPPLVGPPAPPPHAP
ncbi:hypothetical protein Syun_010364 [Stephania yunnanensis]|uniref:Uncharacterized protein n=1 Tax=Stephania yunnanensis TaxID=152371 RepID=A0AAP0KIY7_9MAGN